MDHTDDLIWRGDALQAIDKAAHAERENGWGARVPITLEAALNGIAKVPPATSRASMDTLAEAYISATDANIRLSTENFRLLSVLSKVNPAEQEAELERLRAENERLREAVAYYSGAKDSVDLARTALAPKE